MAEAVKTRLLIGAESRPSLPRHVKLRHDAGRGRWIVLAPERVFSPDERAVEVLKRCNGEATVASIAAALAKDYNAPVAQIEADILSMLQDLADRGVVRA